MKQITTSVLIVGAGPVGLSLAIDLGWRGVACIVIDQSDGKFLLPRASGVTARTMEFCRRWGIRDAVLAAGFPLDLPLNNVFCTSLTGHLLAIEPGYALQDQPPLDFSPENKHRCPQDLYDPVLERAAARYDTVTIMRQCRLDGFTDQGSGVVARVSRLSEGIEYDFGKEIQMGGEAALSPTVEPFEIRARFMVACDGANSGIRDALGIPSEGRRVLSYSTSVLLRIPDLGRHHSFGDAERYLFFGDEGIWGNLTVVDGKDRWRLTIAGSGDKQELTPAEIDTAIRRCLGRDDIPFEIIAITPWRRRQLVAASFGKGNVFLAGDAAHTMSPTGGFGMSTGAGDAVDLGWKIDAVLKGWGGEKLLDSYDAERRPVGVRNTASAADNFAPWTVRHSFSAVSGTTAEAQKQRDELGATLRKLFLREWQTWGTAMGYRYDDSPICIQDGTPAPPDDSMVYVQCARPGARAPHAWLADGRSTLDLFGRGFVLLDFGRVGNDGSRLLDAAAALGLPLAVHHVDDPHIANLYGMRLVLVRPDGHVAWRGEVLPADVKRMLDIVRGAADKAPDSLRSHPQDSSTEGVA